MKDLFSNNSKLNIINILFSIFFVSLAVLYLKPMFFLNIKVVNNIVKNLGFELKDIIVIGNNNINRDDIINKIVFNNCDNLFCIDLEKSKVNLEDNKWIKQVKLKYGLPSKLLVEIEEETPAFLLKNRKKISLLNTEGKKIQDLKVIPENFKDLLVLNGKGVENKIYNLLDIFSKNTSVSDDIKEATLVSSRRWSLKYSFDITIELPEINPDIAFFKIAELQEKYGFLSDKIEKVDLRVSDRMIIQLKNKQGLLEESGI